MGTLGRNPTVVYQKSEGDKFNSETTLECVTCASCGILYAIPSGLVSAAKRWRGDKSNGWSICCPLGHTWHYIGETEAQKARRQLKETRDSLAAERARHDQTRARLAGTKAAKTRMKNERDLIKARAEAMLCPVPGCHRSFKQLRRHMASKHPDWNGDAGDP